MAQKKFARGGGEESKTAVIRAEPGHDLILKTAGLREYFEGNYQLL